MPNEKRQRKKAGRQYRQEQIRLAQQRRRRRNQAIALGIVVLLVGVGAYLASRGDDGTDVAADNTSTTLAGEESKGKTECPKADGTSPRTVKFEGEPPMCIDTAKDYKATIEFDTGTVEVDLAEKDSPVTVNNFVVLARYHFYDGLTCHRVLRGFVNQCGDPAGDGTGGPGYTIQEEPPKSGKYAIGQIAMAKASAPKSTGSQFFVITGDRGAALPPQYSLLGTVTSGMEAAKKIEADGSDQDGVPARAVHKIVKVTITEA